MVHSVVCVMRYRERERQGGSTTSSLVLVRSVHAVLPLITQRRLGYTLHVIGAFPVRLGTRPFHCTTQPLIPSKYSIIF